MRHFGHTLATECLKLSVQSNSTCNGDVSNSQDQQKVNCIGPSTAFATVDSDINALGWKYANPLRSSLPRSLR